jgi:hypothetical protein
MDACDECWLQKGWLIFSSALIASAESTMARPARAKPAGRRNKVTQSG